MFIHITVVTSIEYRYIRSSEISAQFIFSLELKARL